MDPRDYISDSEGRDEDPVEKVVCQACAKECDEVSRCVWDPDLLVGKCCETYIDHQCPDCGSDHLRWEEYDLGTYSETGDWDAAVKVICEECGCECEERETEVRVGPVHAQQPSLFPELDKKPAQREVPAIYREERCG